MCNLRGVTVISAANALSSVRPFGDRAVRLCFAPGPSALTPDTAVRRVCASLARAPLPGVPGIEEWMPGHTSVTVFYNPALTTYDSLCRVLLDIAVRTADAVPAAAPATVVDLPVRYGGTDGPDLLALAAGHGLSIADAVALHAAPLYEVVMLGFLPGFPYLRGLPDALHTPRLPTPRTAVPIGSVGIGGAQTGVYPCAAPGGWHLIGRTETPLFDPTRDPPALLQAGDRVRFVPL